MGVFTSDLLNGLSYGLVVAVLALGFTLVIGTTHLINFAQGEVYMLGAFTGAAVARWSGNLYVAIVCGALLAMCLNVVLYFVVFMRIRRHPMIVTLLAGLGASLVIRTVAGRVLGVTTQPFPDVSVATGRFTLAGQSFSDQIFALAAIGVVMLVAGYLVLYHSTFGLQVRALADSITATEGIGLPLVRLQAGVFALSGLLSGAAGVLIAWYLGTYQFTMGQSALALAFTAAVIGGLGSLPGAVIGGLAVGLVRSFGASWNANLIDAYPFAFLVLFLLLRPVGLFGKRLELH